MARTPLKDGFMVNYLEDPEIFNKSQKRARLPKASYLLSKAGVATNSLFFCCLFFINDPLLGIHFSLPFLHPTPLSLSRNLEGLFELTQRLSRALNFDAYVALELQRTPSGVAR